ncbi:ATPase [Moorella thermoacetica]|uniref:Archaeal ATPase n=3 Tax=Neomoorella thermoacetica TaxID=1525 RepID=A0A1J5K189_NEOTH|nr:AAA family ATPase [Moorella thermoacetica]AKX94550.1 archaeal ATPase [Moorella thermoacetica]AKX97186.1 archaeal ATPase [Moorella thermoacetica]OIQ09537.1 archaeal ATPase [Moorella thermoacetica]OIQ11872.1 archaeal ATPase [Moorella thermoacetica]OIQ57395.1 archaeal ATPase [Moorella thermoacetica]
MTKGLFPLGGPVAKEDLVGREQFIVSLVNRLSEGQSVMLAGPRRIGKTSLAHEVLRRMKNKGAYTAAVDFFRFSGKRDFAASLIDACLENRTGINKTLNVLRDRAKAMAGGAQFAIKLKDLEISFGFPDKKSDDELLDYALKLPGILADRDEKVMVVMFDEFQEASRVTDPEIFKRMRAHFQTQKGVAYLFLGSKEGMMQTLFGGRKEAFYRFAIMLPIPIIAEDDWIPYITQKFASRNIQTDAEVVKEIIQFSGGHPQDTMFLCSEVYYTLLETGNNVLTRDYVRLGYNRAMLALAPIFDEMLDDLSTRPQVRRVLYQLAAGENVYQEGIHPNKIKRAVDHLISRAVIEKTARGSYVFVEPMFQQYILQQFQ